MTAPTPPPKYIYKILPSNPAPPSPLPEALPISSLDARDGFLHMSTSTQILGTLRNFFANADAVYILRILYEDVEKFIKWEDSKGLSPDEKGGCWDTEGKAGYFPHIYGNGPDGRMRMGREEVESVGQWVRSGAVWGVEGWCFGDENVPKA